MGERDEATNPESPFPWQEDGSSKKKESGKKPKKNSKRPETSKPTAKKVLDASALEQETNAEALVSSEQEEENGIAAEQIGKDSDEEGPEEVSLHLSRESVQNQSELAARAQKAVRELKLLTKGELGLFLSMQTQDQEQWLLIYPDCLSETCDNYLMMSSIWHFVCMYYRIVIGGWFCNVLQYNLRYIPTHLSSVFHQNRASFSDIVNNSGSKTRLLTLIFQNETILISTQVRHLTLHTTSFIGRKICSKPWAFSGMVQENSKKNIICPPKKGMLAHTLKSRSLELFVDMQIKLPI